MKHAPGWLRRLSLMRTSLALCLLLLLLAAPALAQSSGTDPAEDPTSPASQPAATECRPPALCLPGQVVSAPLQALSTEDARAALLAVAMLSESEAVLSRCEASGTELQAALDRCRTDFAALPASCPALSTAPVPATGPTDWAPRAAWLFGGLAVGVAAGVALSLAMTGGN